MNGAELLLAGYGLLALAIYFTPTVIAYRARVGFVRFAFIAIGNLFLGWTILGWAIVLLVALTDCENAAARRIESRL